MEPLEGLPAPGPDRRITPSTENLSVLLAPFVGYARGMLDRRVLMAGGGGVLLGAAAMAVMGARQPPGQGIAPRNPVTDPCIPAEPGGPNAIGQLVVEAGGAPPRRASRRAPTVPGGSSSTGRGAPA